MAETLIDPAAIIAFAKQVNEQVLERAKGCITELSRQLPLCLTKNKRNKVQSRLDAWLLIQDRAQKELGISK